MNDIQVKGKGVLKMDESRFSYLINYKFINSSGDKGCVFGVYDKKDKKFYYVDVFPNNASHNTYSSFHCSYFEIDITGREEKGSCNGKDYIDDIEYLVENKVDEIEADSIMIAINKFIQTFQGVSDVVDFVLRNLIFPTASADCPSALFYGTIHRALEDAESCAGLVIFNNEHTGCDHVFVFKTNNFHFRIRNFHLQKTPLKILYHNCTIPGNKCQQIFGK